MKILLAVDGSTYTKHMLAYIAAHDELVAPSNEFTALTVVPPVPPHASRFLSHSVLEDYYRDEAQRVLDPVRHFAAQHGWKLQAQQLVGQAGDAIAQFAAEGRFDLVVLGSHGHSALANVVLGSVAARVLAQCKTPLLIVR